MIEWILNRLFERADIGRGDNGGLYLTRWTLVGKRWTGKRRVFLHRFHRSDNDVPHDHPWPFVSLILWPGYFEETPRRGRRWYGPLRVLQRTAEWVHRVVLKPGRGCWTLVVAGERVRQWGFHCPDGFRPFPTATEALDTKGSVCA